MASPPNRAQLQKVCDFWNNRNPVGAPVEYQKYGQGEWHTSLTNGEAYVMGGKVAVIDLLGVAGPVDLTWVRLRTLTPTQRAD